MGSVEIALSEWSDEAGGPWSHRKTFLERLRAHGVGHRESRAERIREIWPICVHDVYLRVRM